jgi:hypothetical protein
MSFRPTGRIPVACTKTEWPLPDEVLGIPNVASHRLVAGSIRNDNFQQSG